MRQMHIQNEIKDTNEEGGVQMFDDVDFGHAHMQSFKHKSSQLLLEEDKAEMDYDIPLDLPGAYKALKGILSKPVIVHSKRPKANYMKPTFSTS